MWNVFIVNDGFGFYFIGQPAEAGTENDTRGRLKIRALPDE
jgi:hypothetical protein